jgi:uncharacterized protein (TIGR03067 family)
MRHLLGLSAFVALAFPVLAEDNQDAAKKLNGAYELASVTIDGKPFPGKKETTTFTIKDGTITVKEGDKKEETSKFTVDASKTPHTIDIMPQGKTDRPVTGIYELKDMDLTLVISEGKDRPTDIKGGKDQMVIKLRKKQ